MPNKPLRKVIVESPFKGATPEVQQKNIEYARACARDCLINHHETPFLSHLLYTQPGILNDAFSEERQLGIEAGLAWGENAEATIVYTDLGVSEGMVYGINNAIEAGRLVEYRKLKEE